MLPISLDADAYSDLLTKPDIDEPGMDAVAARILAALEFCDAMKITAHNKMVRWFKNRWMGTVMTRYSVMGTVLKFISQN